MTPTAAPIRRASTVIILRDRPRGPEVFLVRRTTTIAFMAGAHVFPGGRVDAGDDGADDGWCDLPDADAAGRFPEWSFAVSAARELFEEAGVLLARRSGVVRATPARLAKIDDAGRAALDRHRDAVHGGTERLRDVLSSMGLRLAIDVLVPFAHWLTPPLEVRRFDTWFFMTRVPEGQRPIHDGHESVESGWFRPADALAACAVGRIHLPPPTWATLRELEPFVSTDEALIWAGRRVIQERQPILTEHDGLREIFLPGDPRHPTAEAVAYETHFVWANGAWLPKAIASGS